MLDTNVILFGLFEPKRIRPSVKARLLDTNERVFASVASLYEIGFKANLGKLALPFDFDIRTHLRTSDIELLEITAEHALRASQLPLAICDPWDRVIVAQSLCEKLSLVSSDADIEALGINRIW
jgi:PIN domain nuclease of toxin-antitoxin system